MSAPVELDRAEWEPLRSHIPTAREAFTRRVRRMQPAAQTHRQQCAARSPYTQRFVRKAQRDGAHLLQALRLLVREINLQRAEIALQLRQMVGA